MPDVFKCCRLADIDISVGADVYTFEHTTAHHDIVTCPNATPMQHLKNKENRHEMSIVLPDRAFAVNEPSTLPPRPDAALSE